MKDSFLHARRLRRFLEGVIITASAGVCGYALASCGGRTVDEEPAADAASEEAGIDDASLDGTGVGMPGCRPTGTTDAGSFEGCRAVLVQVTGDRVACGFESRVSKFGAECADFCGSSYYGRCEFRDRQTVVCFDRCVVDGRRSPDVEGCIAADNSLDAFFALAAHNEAASVHAFALLGKELRARRAPRSLLRSIDRARRDEAAHASRAARLSRGRRVPGVARIAIAPRSTLAIALDNAREGCGRELFGACVGLLLAKRAATPELREHYAAIAHDELRHATLSFRMHDWLASKLSQAEQMHVHNEMIKTLRGARVSLPEALGEIGDCQAIALCLADALSSRRVVRPSA